MESYSYILTRPLDWQRNKAPNITAILNKKQDWYTINHTNFWNRWRADVFDLRTASSFGLLVWSVILDVPAQAFVLFPGDIFWGFGTNRQNFFHVDSPGGQSEGGNFLGGTEGVILTTEEARKALRLKYYALTISGTVTQINHALRGIFGVDGLGQTNAWVVDNYDVTMTYYHRDTWSANFVQALTLYDLLPKVAGVSYDIVAI